MRIIKNILIGLGSLVLLTALAFGGRLLWGILQINQTHPEQAAAPSFTLGEVHSLTVLPLVESTSADPSLQGDMGVSYLIYADETLILFDMGMNYANLDPSPVRSNLDRLGVDLDEIDAIVISHSHSDHTGGQRWGGKTFSLDSTQIALGGLTAYTPIPMKYPGLQPVHAETPQLVAPGVMTTGVLPFLEPLSFSSLSPINSEQSLVVNVQGQGLVVITGCGHPGAANLLARVQSISAEPVAGVLGGLHYLNASQAEIQPDIDLLQALDLQVIGLSSHDSRPSVIQIFSETFGERYSPLEIGRSISISGAD